MAPEWDEAAKAHGPPGPVLAAGNPRIVLADAHAPTRALIRDILSASGLEVCAEAADATAAISAVANTRPDLALLEVDMPGGGICAAAAIASGTPAPRVVMMSPVATDDDLFTALRAGASGYLLKDMDLVRLPAVLRGVIAGEAALPRTLAARLITEFRRRDRRRYLSGVSRSHDRLTPREWDVLELLDGDLTTEQIAHRLFVAKVTVRTHIAAILHKLEVTSRAEAIRVFRTGGDVG